MKTTISILFYLKRVKANAQGLVPIFQRITVNGKRMDSSTGQFIDPIKWSVEGAKMKGTSEQSRAVNSQLDSLKAKVRTAEHTIETSGAEVTFETLKSFLSGESERARMLIPIFEDHNNRMRSLLHQEYAPGTLERYNTSLKHTKNFLTWKYSLSDINLTKIDHAFVSDYDFYLRSVCKCANNTTVKYIKNFKKIVRICIANGWIAKDPFLNYKVKLKEVERPFLTDHELLAIIEKNFMVERLNLVRDIFVFSCYTGLAYIDVAQLSSANICLGIDGNKWIYKNRQKTDSESRIPLLQIPQEIIEKYAEHPQCLNKGTLIPILSNQRMNSYLKEIADVCNINKDLTFHVARHTFATTVTLTNGVPMESVSKMLGHKSLKTTQHYAKILDKKVSDDMQTLREKLSINSNNSIKSLSK